MREKGTLVVAEGYLLELARRGFNSNGSFVPLVSRMVFGREDALSNAIYLVYTTIK